MGTPEARLHCPLYDRRSHINDRSKQAYRQAMLPCHSAEIGLAAIGRFAVNILTVSRDYN